MNAIYVFAVLLLMVCGAFAAPPCRYGSQFNGPLNSLNPLDPLNAMYASPRNLFSGMRDNSFLRPYTATRSFMGASGGGVWRSGRNLGGAGIFPFNQNSLPTYNTGAIGMDPNSFLNTGLGLGTGFYGLSPTATQDDSLMSNPVVRNLLRSYQSNGLTPDQFAYSIDAAAQQGQIRLDQAQMLKQMVLTGQMQGMSSQQSLFPIGAMPGRVPLF